MIREYCFILLVLMGFSACGEQANNQKSLPTTTVALQNGDDGVLRLANPAATLEASGQLFASEPPSVKTTNSETANTATDGTMNEAMEIEVAASISKYLKDKSTLLSSVNTNYESEAYKKLKKFYSARGSRAVWTNFKRIDAYIGALRRATRHGLNPEHYALSDVVSAAGAARGAALSSSKRGKLDVLLSNSFMNYGSDLLHGRFRPAKEWEVVWRKRDLVQLLSGITKGNDPVSAVNSICPKKDAYWSLTKKIQQYQAAAKKGGWELFTYEIGPGDSGSQVGALARRLAAMGDLPANYANTSSASFDGTVTNGLKKFQRRHGLPATGTADQRTRNALNVSFESRIQEIKLAMNRYRWTPDYPGKKYVWVNIPEYKTYVIENDKAIADIISVVGEVNNKTPVMMNKKFLNVILSPSWNLPYSIAQEELEFIRKDPAVLIVTDVDVLLDGKKVSPTSINWHTVDLKRVRLKQRPKKRNAMGQAKFMFQNNHSIFLHDTPNKVDFDSDMRAQSHGCIRVSEPALFAAKLLKGKSGWSMGRIQKAMDSGKEQFIKPPTSIKVHINYLTTWVDKNGELQHREDIYGHDIQQLQRL